MNRFRTLVHQAAVTRQLRVSSAKVSLTYSEFEQKLRHAVRLANRHILRYATSVSPVCLRTITLQVTEVVTYLLYMTSQWVANVWLVNDRSTYLNSDHRKFVSTFFLQLIYKPIMLIFSVNFSNFVSPFWGQQGSSLTHILRGCWEDLSYFGFASAL